MKLRALVFGAMAALLVATAPAEAAKRRSYRAPPVPKVVNISIDISSQSMMVTVHGFPYAYWKVSTARDGYWTPRGRYRVQRMAKVYYSRKYDDAPMPNSIFFKGGYAIHGSGHVRALGRPASHGCVRLHPNNAARLYALVKEYGASATGITIKE